MIVVDDSDDDNLTLLLIMFVVIKILMIWYAIKSGMRVNTVCTIPLKVATSKKHQCGHMQYSVSNIFFICVDSKSVLYALKNWDCKMRGGILYEVKYLIHCIMYRGIGTEFCWVPSH